MRKARGSTPRPAGSATSGRSDRSAKSGRSAKFSRATTSAYLYGSATALFVFLAFGVWFSFFQIWLTSPAVGLKLTGAEVGTVFTLNSIGTLAVMFAYGAIQDHLFLRRHILIASLTVVALHGPFVQFVYFPALRANFWVGAALGGAVFSAGFFGLIALVEAYVERVSRVYCFEYGSARMWGSFGFAAAALLAGFVFTINPFAIFWLASAFGVVALAIQVFWRLPSPDSPDDVGGRAGARAPAPSRASLADMKRLLRDRRVWVVIGFVMLTWTFYVLFDSQMFPDFYTSLFVDSATGERAFGVAYSVQVFLEAAAMGAATLVFRRIGVKKSFLLAITFLGCRVLVAAASDSAALITVSMMLRSMEVPLLVLGIFRYFALHFNPALSATLFLVGWNVSAQIGQIVLSTPLGAVRDSLGYQPTFLIIAGIAALAWVYTAALMKADDEDVWGGRV